MAEGTAMNVRFYPPDEGLTADEIRRGLHWLSADVTCPACGFEQPVLATAYIGGPCSRCGQRTDGSPT